MANRVCWIGFLVYLAADGQFARGSLDWMHEVQARHVEFGKNRYKFRTTLDQGPGCGLGCEGSLVGHSLNNPRRVATKDLEIAILESSRGLIGTSKWVQTRSDACAYLKSP
jgi:hypothetical protein